MMATALRQMDLIQKDALREMANIGSGHAATVLSKLTGLRIMIDVPEICIAPFDGLLRWLPAAEQSLVVLATRMLGDLSGDTYFLLPEAGARALSDLLLGRQIGSARELDEMDRSSLVEAGNIVASSFMNALARSVGRLLMPSVPALRVCSHGEWHNSHADSEFVLLVETRFYLDSGPGRSASLPAGVDAALNGAFVFAPHAASFEHLFAILLGYGPEGAPGG